MASGLWANYVSVETGERVEVNDWVLIDKTIAKDDKGEAYKNVHKYCSVTNIIDETQKKPNTYAKKTKKNLINAYGYVWFIVNDMPIQSFTTQNIFQDVLTGRRNLTLPETCEIELKNLNEKLFRN